MSYCRRGWDGNQLYVYWHTDGFIECSGCEFDDPWIVSLHSVDEAIEHVAKHRAAGHVVPDGLEDDIRAENPWSVTA
jgi:hypothetical protein